MTPRQHFEAELEPLLIAAEQAITAADDIEARTYALMMLELVQKYAPLMPPHEMRAVLNNPIATAIAKRLGVQP